ncbi:MAG: uroporphyrinogen decarboxylase family protein [Candidatus Dormibacteraceae bacterium]
MNSRSRIEAAIAFRPVDRPPVSSWGHTYREEWSAADLARVSVERQRRFGWDFVKFQPRASCFAEAFGSVYQRANHALRAPKLISQAVRSLDDWSRINIAAAGHAALADQVTAIGLAAKELGPDVPIVQTVFSPITVAGYLVGKDRRRALRQLRENPEIVGPALERIAAVLVEFSRQSVEAGAAGVFYAVSGYASADLVKADEYERLLLPYDRLVLDQLPAAAWFNILHLCGSHLNFELARDLPTQVVSWSIANQGNPGLAEGRERAGGRPVMGGMNFQSTLHHGTVAQVRAEAGAAIAATGATGFFLAPGCSVRPGARSDNLAAMAAAAAA